MPMIPRQAWFLCWIGVGAFACGDDASSDGDTDPTAGTSGSSSGTSSSTSVGATFGSSTEPSTSSTDAGPGSDSSEGSGSDGESGSSGSSDVGDAGSTGEAGDASTGIPGETTAQDGSSSSEAESSSTGDGGDETGIIGEPVCRPIDIPIEDFFPEGISADAEGNVYVGSLGAQQIVRRRGCTRGDEIPLIPFVDDPTLRSVVGILVDDALGVLWACDSDGEALMDAEVRGYALAGGALVAEHPFGAEGETGFCNDLALDADGNLYATDSASGRIMRIPAVDLLTDGAVAEVWATSPVFEPSGQFSLNGIAFDGVETLYAVMSEGGRLFRFDVTSASPATFVEIVLDRALQGGDGLEWLGAGRLLVNENAENRVSIIELGDDDQATVTTVIDDLEDQPTTSVLVGDTLFIVQAQLDAMQAGEPGTLPFRVVTRPRP